MLRPPPHPQLGISIIAQSETTYAIPLGERDPKKRSAAAIRRRAGARNEIDASL
jgi:hypothetical protein